MAHTGDRVRALSPSPPPPLVAPAPTTAGADALVFDIRVLVHGCSNIPHHANARVYCKWKLPSAASGLAARSGVLPSAETTTSHLVAWDALIDVPGCVLRVDRDSRQLKPAVLRLSIRQESRLAMHGFTRLGIVQIDLAEFAGQTGVERTYLLENARLNSTLTVTVNAEQVGGDVMFRRRSSGSACVGEEGGSPDGRLARRLQVTSGAGALLVSSAPSTQGHLLHHHHHHHHHLHHASPHTIYQVVGDILRISEENRTSRNSSHLDVTPQGQ